jgi:hypothetical protein
MASYFSTGGPGTIRRWRWTWSDLWASNRAVVEAYDLAPGDLGHLHKTFPVFDRKHSAFFAYIQQRLVEWAEEERRDSYNPVLYTTDFESTAKAAVAERPDKKGDRMK